MSLVFQSLDEKARPESLCGELQLICTKKCWNLSLQIFFASNFNLWKCWHCHKTSWIPL